MSSVGSWYYGTVDWLMQLFMVAVEGRARVRAHGALKLGQLALPQDGVTLFRRRGDFDRRAMLGAADALLVVEVSEASSHTDQMVKIPLFAHFGVPEVWIVDRVHETLHFYRAPSGGEYTDVSSTDKPGVVALVALPEVKVDLSDLFG